VRISNSGSQTGSKEKQTDIPYTTVSEHNVRQKHRQIPKPIHFQLSFFFFFPPNTVQIPKKKRKKKRKKERKRWNMGLGIEALLMLLLLKVNATNRRPEA
jgi:hypothetical protein